MFRVSPRILLSVYIIIILYFIKKKKNQKFAYNYRVQLILVCEYLYINCRDALLRYNIMVIARDDNTIDDPWRSYNIRVQHIFLYFYARFAYAVWVQRRENKNKKWKMKFETSRDKYLPTRFVYTLYYKQWRTKELARGNCGSAISERPLFSSRNWETVYF